MTTNKINFANTNVNPTGQGVFGFSNFAELWNGRMAMIGFVAALAGEVTTGKGILGQIGINTSGGDVLVALFLAGFTAAAIIGYYAVKLSNVQAIASENS
ncbi:Chlorophyll A-B binding protein [Synechococcus sp. PCC 7502]|uniref:chlorophyll a/b-binding protein n=1 Tax=Synechococcus sp. PCC 7502 TaxID=1173263 RepID=UPI00029F8ACA|nr:chlorophyll a/b-binding protein [Synechococcus sp. PCC 7502]AFY73996.1 Chlorophyll A-B binding protein [Synechococcus sp. PCC 7502]